MLTTKEIIPELWDLSLMHQEHVTLTNIEIEQLYAAIEKYLQDLKLDIIHEDRFPNYSSLKAYKVAH